MFVVKNKEKSMKILVIDDKPENLESARITLEGHELTLCGSIDEARSPLIEGEFDAVLTDLFMPVKGGQETLGEARRLFWAQPEGTMLPAGLVFALKAAARGIPVGIATDANHHQDLVCALLFDLDPYLRAPIKPGTARVKFWDCSRGRGWNEDGTKDWAVVLNAVMGI